MTEVRWLKSSRSQGEIGNCVELGHGLDAVRDSKNPGGPVLAADVRVLLARVRSGQFDR
jgi:hypothetical protein